MLTAHAVVRGFKQPLLQLFYLQPPAIYIGQIFWVWFQLIPFNLSISLQVQVFAAFKSFSTFSYLLYLFIRESSRKISLTLVPFLAFLTQAASPWLTNHSPAFTHSVWWILYYNWSLKFQCQFFWKKRHSDRLNKSTHEKNVILRHI